MPMACFQRVDQANISAELGLVNPNKVCRLRDLLISCYILDFDMGPCIYHFATLKITPKHACSILEVCVQEWAELLEAFSKHNRTTLWVTGRKGVLAWTAVTGIQTNQKRNAKV